MDGPLNVKTSQHIVFKAARLLQRNVLIEGKKNVNKFRHFLCSQNCIQMKEQFRNLGNLLFS